MDEYVPRQNNNCIDQKRHCCEFHDGRFLKLFNLERRCRKAIEYCFSIVLYSKRCNGSGFCGISDNVKYLDGVVFESRRKLIQCFP